MSRKSKNSPIAEGILQRKRAQEEAERQRREAAAYRSPRQIAEAERQRRQEEATEAELKADFKTKREQLIAEILDLLEETGYPYAEFLTFEKRSFFGLVRKPYTVAAWHLESNTNHCVETSSYTDENTGYRSVTGVRVEQEDVYLLEGGTIRTSRMAHTESASSAIRHDTDDWSNSATGRSVSGYYEPKVRRPPRGVDASLVALKVLLEEKSGRRQRPDYRNQ